MHTSIPVILSLVFLSPALGFPNHPPGSLYIRNALPAAYSLDSFHPLSQRDRRIMGYKAINQRNAAPELLRRYPAHEALAAAGGAYAAHEHFKNEEAQGVDVHHKFLKEVGAGVVAAEVDKHVEGHGNNKLNRRYPAHEVIAAAGGAYVAHKHFQDEEAQGVTVHHKLAKEVGAGIVAAEVDKHVEGHR